MPSPRSDGLQAHGSYYFTPPGAFSPFLTVQVHYRSSSSMKLTAVLSDTRFHLSRTTSGTTSTTRHRSTYTIHAHGQPSQTAPTPTTCNATLRRIQHGPTTPNTQQPPPSHASGLALLRYRSATTTEYLLLRVLRCFTPRVPHHPYTRSEMMVCAQPHNLC